MAGADRDILKQAPCSHHCLLPANASFHSGNYSPWNCQRREGPEWDSERRRGQPGAEALPARPGSPPRCPRPPPPPGASQPPPPRSRSAAMAAVTIPTAPRHPAAPRPGRRRARPPAGEGQPRRG